MAPAAFVIASYWPARLCAPHERHGTGERNQCSPPLRRGERQDCADHGWADEPRRDDPPAREGISPAYAAIDKSCGVSTSRSIGTASINPTGPVRPINWACLLLAASSRGTLAET
jgi:hypothetical protein